MGEDELDDLLGFLEAALDRSLDLVGVSLEVLESLLNLVGSIFDPNTNLVANDPRPVLDLFLIIEEVAM